MVIDRVRRWLETDAFIDRLLDDVTDDRAFVMEVAYGIARWKALLEWMIAQRCPRRPPPLPLAALMTGCYQLFFMDHVQPHAAVHETVEGLRRLGGERSTGLVNAILRGCLRRQEELLAAMQQLPADLRLSHPPALLARWRPRLGEAGTLALCAWNNTRPTVAIHPLTQHTTAAAYLALLREQGLDAQPHPYRPDDFILLPRGLRVPDLPGYDEGLFSVQDPATAAAVDLLAPQAGERILDACAAPGGKTILIAERTRGEGELIAMDISATRLTTLRANVRRLRLPVTLVEGDIIRPPAAVTAAPFHRILLDVPCTNTGVLQRRPDARWRFSEAHLAEMVQRQAAILTAAAPHLAPGGVLVYSTCSLEPEENAQLVETWSRAQGFRITAMHQSQPPQTACDGAFAARLERAE